MLGATVSAGSDCGGRPGETEKEWGKNTSIKYDVNHLNTSIKYDINHLNTSIKYDINHLNTSIKYILRLSMM